MHLVEKVESTSFTGTSFVVFDNYLIYSNNGINCHFPEVHSTCSGDQWLRAGAATCGSCEL